MKTLHEIKSQNIVQEVKKVPDPPTILVLKRKAIRQFPSGKRVALYHNDKLGIDISVPYSSEMEPEIAGGISEEVLIEKEHDDMFGDYTNALKLHYKAGSKHTDHPELAKLKEKIIQRYGKQAHSHLHAAAEHYLNNNVGQATHRYNKFLRTINENFEEYLYPESMEEAVIHKIHHIAKTKTDGEVVFGNGSRHKLSAQQAAHLVKLHTMMTPQNKATIEKHMSSPEGLTKVADFAAQNLK
jgi:hypothetical protein